MAEGDGPRNVEVAPSDRPVQVSGIASAELDGEVVLLDGSGRSHLLNSTGGLLWALFDGHRRVEQIAADAAEAFGVPYGTVLAEMCTFVNEMVALGVVAVRPSSETEIPS